LRTIGAIGAQQRQFCDATGPTAAPTAAPTTGPRRGIHYR